MATYIAYYRVSTKAQGNSGLGLGAQRVSVAGFVKGAIVAEFTEVESGKNNQRLQLTAAIERAKKEGAVLVIAKLDRLSRNASIFTLRDSGVSFQCVDMPAANTLTIGIFATLAQHERELISSRTKAALAVKKAQSARLGKPQNLPPRLGAQRATWLRPAPTRTTGGPCRWPWPTARRARTWCRSPASPMRPGFALPRAAPFRPPRLCGC